MKKIFLAFLIASASFLNQAFAQEKLTVEEAVRIALENNYGIKISKNDLEIAKTNVSRVNAGMLPAIGGQLNTNTSVQNSTQTLSSGQTQERNGAKNTSFNYGAVLNWTVFDGFAMFANYDRLKELQKAGETNFRLSVLTTVSDVISNYYDLVKQKQDIRATDTALAISRLRLRNAKNRYEYGKAAKLEVLQATVDLNADTTNLLRQRDLYKATQIRLNELLVRDLSSNFSVADTIIIDKTLKLPELQNLTTDNPVLQSAIINQRLAELNLKSVKALKYPQIDVYSGYNFSKSTSALGFARSNQGHGLNYGISATIPIFNWGLQRRNEKIVSLEIDNAKLDYSRLNQNISSQLLSLYQSYLTAIELVNLESQNVSVAKQNLDITLEKYKYGSVAPVEFREAQRNYINATTRYTSAQYDAKVSETNLKEISGTINLNQQ